MDCHLLVFDKDSYSKWWRDYFLIAKITNVTLSDFREALLTAVGANEFIWDNQLRAKLPSAHITTYQYKPGVGVVNTIREGI